jgi:hypothetical protein
MIEIPLSECDDILFSCQLYGGLTGLITFATAYLLFVIMRPLEIYVSCDKVKEDNEEQRGRRLTKSSSSSDSSFSDDSSSD